MLKKISVISLIISSLQACTTLEVVHAELDCPGVPKHYVTFTDDEIKNTPDSVLDKFSTISRIYKARIERQCKMISDHNKLHGE